MAASLPEPNKRIKELVDEKAGGNVSRFVNMINETSGDSIISQQRFNRLFLPDTRTNAYPTIQHDIFEAILKRFPDIDAYRLITGQQKTGPEKEPVDKKVIIKVKQSELEALRANFDKVFQGVQPAQGEAQSKQTGFLDVTFANKVPKKPVRKSQKNGNQDNR